MIEVKDFYKQYKSHIKGNSFAVKNVSFTIKTGEITALVGPNGSGKSTIIKAICGFHYPSSGQILISGNDEKSIDISENSEKAMELCGYVPEITALPPDMRVIDFLSYVSKLHKLDQNTAEKRIEKLIKDFELSDFINNRIKILSKGQQQRVSFAQALIHDPPNLILDEPVNGLDPAQIIAFRKYVKELGKTKAVLISTHILSEVSALCTKAFIVINGKIKPVKDLNNIEQEFMGAEK